MDINPKDLGDKEKRIIDFLIKNNQRGATIQDIVDDTGLAWNTITKVLAKLEGGENLEIRIVGRAKLHYLNEEVKNQNESTKESMEN